MYLLIKFNIFPQFVNAAQVEKSQFNKAEGFSDRKLLRPVFAAWLSLTRDMTHRKQVAKEKVQLSNKSLLTLVLVLWLYGRIYLWNRNESVVKT